MKNATCKTHQPLRYENRAPLQFHFRHFRNCVSIFRLRFCFVSIYRSFFLLIFSSRTPNFRVCGGGGKMCPMLYFMNGHSQKIEKWRSRKLLRELIRFWAYLSVAWWWCGGWSLRFLNDLCVLRLRKARGVLIEVERRWGGRRAERRRGEEKERKGKGGREAHWVHRPSTFSFWALECDWTSEERNGGE